LFTYHSIQDYHKDLQNGITSCADAVAYYLQRIDATRHLNAFIEVYAEESLARAQALDAARTCGAPLQALHGVVIGIKDVIAYQGHTLTAASGMLKGYTTIFSATAVERLLAAGAIIIGNLNCDEFAMGSSNENSVYGPVKNAIDDTGGSVRQPADFCGIVGFKPGYGRISRYGLIAYASSFDQIGIFAQNIPDVAALLEVMAGPDEMDSTASARPAEAYTGQLSSPAGLQKLAYFKEALEHPGLDPEIAATFRRFIAQLQADGHTITPVEFEYLDYIVPAYYVLTTAEASSNLSRYDGIRYGHQHITENIDLTQFYQQNRSEGFGSEVQRRILLGTFVLSAGYYDAYFTKAQQVRSLLVSKTELIFKDFDALILPTVPTTAFKIGEKSNDPIEMYLADIYTVFANLTGIPGISLPLFTHSNGLPFGLQVMTNRFNEVPLLRLSYQLMRQYKSPARPV
jgi:aspartyl-tRNA(Asn)/glutamyl-tRNA(Gln) amidotransferase subunit A